MPTLSRNLAGLCQGSGVICFYLQQRCDPLLLGPSACLPPQPSDSSQARPQRSILAVPTHLAPRGPQLTLPGPDNTHTRAQVCRKHQHWTTDWLCGHGVFTANGRAHYRVSGKSAHVLIQELVLTQQWRKRRREGGREEGEKRKRKEGRKKRKGRKRKKVLPDLAMRHDPTWHSPETRRGHMFIQGLSHPHGLLSFRKQFVCVAEILQAFKMQPSKRRRRRRQK